MVTLRWDDLADTNIARPPRPIFQWWDRLDPLMLCAEKSRVRVPAKGRPDSRSEEIPAGLRLGHPTDVRAVI